MKLSTSHKAAPDEQLLASIERLDRERSEIARRMAEVSWSEVPEYGAVISEERQAEMVRHADLTLRLLSDVVRAGATFDSADLEFVRANAELRAEQGFPLEAILHAYRFGQRVIADFDLSLAGPAIDLLNAISTALTEAYVRRRHELETDRERDRADLLDALLAGAAQMSQAERMHAAEAGISGASGGLVVVVCAGTASREDLRRFAREFEREVSTAAALAAVRSREVVGVLALGGVSTGRVRKWAEAALRRCPSGPAMRVGISEVASHTDEIPRAHRDARRAAAQAPPGGVRSIAEIPLVELLIADAATDQGDVRAWPGALATADRSRKELSRTLSAYLEADQNVVRTASALGVHPNTVHYRLRKIEAVTGLDPRRFGDAVELMVGSRLHERQHIDRPTRD